MGALQGLFGSLDETYVSVEVKNKHKVFFRNRKGNISVNVLGVCDRNMRFVYVLTGWEGSAADSKVLREAMDRESGLKIPIGNFYLVDSGYANAPGFLAPFRGERYHLQEWSTGRRAPHTAHEYYNMKHSSARNVIERTFGLWKKRWGILRSPSFYSIETHNHIILACSLLHNFLRNVAPTDLLQDEETDSDSEYEDEEPIASHNTPTTDYIADVDAQDPAWDVREMLATLMFNRWRNALPNRNRH